MNATRYVVDASVFVAAIRRDEPEHDAAREVLQFLSGRGLQLFAPSILLPEIASALARRGGAAADIEAIVAAIETLHGGRMAAVDDHLALQAVRLAAGMRLRGCDAVYVALAAESGASLVSLDAEQRSRTPPGIPALTPSEVLAQRGR